MANVEIPLQADIKTVEQTLRDAGVRLQSRVPSSASDKWSDYAVDSHFEKYVLQSIKTIEDAEAFLAKLDKDSGGSGCTKARVARSWYKNENWKSPNSLRVPLAHVRRVHCSCHQTDSFAPRSASKMGVTNNNKAKESTMKKTQVTIKVAGQQRTMEFSNQAAADAFVKGASAKFGSKFEVVSKTADAYDPEPVTSGISDIDSAPPVPASFNRGTEPYEAQTIPSTREYVIMVGDQYVLAAHDGTFRLVSEDKATHYDGEYGAKDAKQDAVEVKNSGMAGGNMVKVVPAFEKTANTKQPSTEEMSRQMAKCNCPEKCNVHPKGKKAELKLNNEGRSDEAETHPDFCECDACKHNEAYDKEYKKEAGFSFAPSQIQSQVLENFYPEIMHEIVEYPNASNSPMPAQMTGDPHEVPGEENGAGDLPDALEDAFEGMTRIGYVSTSPSGAMGIGRDGKAQVLEGAPLRKENDIRGPMFSEEFYDGGLAVPGAAFASLTASKTAGADEKTQFGLFLKKVMGEVAATFIGAFKATTRMPLNKVPGLGEIQLAFFENPTGINVVGSRVKYLVDKLNDSEIQDCINAAFSQAAVWCEAKEGGYVYEVFVRSESLDSESLILKYKFVCGTKDSEE